VRLKPGRKRLKPSGKPEGSDQPIKRAALDSVLLKPRGRDKPRGCLLG
jgi:hypothetical protein